MAEHTSGWGGRREGAGRSKGSCRPSKTKRTSVFCQRVTPEEKDFLTKILKAMRCAQELKLRMIIDFADLSYKIERNIG